MPAFHDVAVRNGLLASLSPDALAALLPKLILVDAPTRQVIYNPDTAIEAVYFPVSGMISLVAHLDEGVKAEVGMIGREGVLGVSLLSGANTSFVEAVVRMPGAFLRMTGQDFRREMGTNTPLRILVSRYSEFLQAQIMQTAACNGRHGLEQRLPRWLLMAHDRVDGDVLPLTQELLAIMLGVLRPSISIAASTLQRKKLIRYAAGHIAVLDRAGLEDASCECYAAVQQRFAALLKKNEVSFQRTVMHRRQATASMMVPDSPV
jgi:CRP-like cAMP-binding protein